jgi:hypothetical protein
MSVVPITPVSDPSSTSEIAIQWQLVQDARNLAADQAAQASRQTLARGQARVDSDEVLAAAVAAQQSEVKQQIRAGLDGQAVQQALVKEQILASQDIHASQEILATQVVRATQEVQPNPQVDHGEEVTAIQQSSGASTAAANSEPPVDVRL